MLNSLQSVPCSRQSTLSMEPAGDAGVPGGAGGSSPARLVAPAATCLLAFVAALALAFALSVPAWAAGIEGGQGIQTAQSRELSGQDIGTSSPGDDAVVYVSSEGESVDQGTLVTWTYDLSGLREASYSTESWKMEIASCTGAGAVRHVALDAEGGLFSITALKAGKVTLTCKESWIEEEEDWDEAADEWVATQVPQSQVHTFEINAVSLANLSGDLSAVVTSDWASASFDVKIEGLPENADVDLISDSNKKGYSSIREVSAGKVALYVYGTGTHKIKLSACGKTIPCKLVLCKLKLKKTAAVKNTGSVVAYPGQKSRLKVSLTSTAKKPKVKWSSTNKQVAKVTKKGVVKAKGKGRCYVKAKVKGATLKVLVEVTSVEGYRAVKNGFRDMKAKLAYSQANRMSAEYRDCSAFVSRCYWDSSLGRRIALIGEGADQWALTAAGQAQWLNEHGKRVAWKACSVKKLRPGDTVYFETDYAGKDSSRWRYIDHAALYVGNGLMLNTGGYGGKGTIGFRSYYKKDSSVKFIGRPCP